MGNLQTMAVVDSLRKKSSVDAVWEQAANTANGMDKTLFVELMNGLWSGMGRNTMPDKTTLRVWYLCLHQLTVEQFGTAIRRYLTERSAEFVNVQLILELSGAKQSAEEAALLAWDVAIRAIRLVGSYAVPEFDDPAISRTIESLGGWEEFCGQNPEQLRKFVRSRFLKAHETFSRIPRLAPVRLKCLIDRNGDKATTLRVGHSTQNVDVITAIDNQKNAIMIHGD